MKGVGFMCFCSVVSTYLLSVSCVCRLLSCICLSGSHTATTFLAAYTVLDEYLWRRNDFNIMGWTFGQSCTFRIVYCLLTWLKSICNRPLSNHLQLKTLHIIIKLQKIDSGKYWRAKRHFRLCIMNIAGGGGQSSPSPAVPTPMMSEWCDVNVM